MTAAPDPCAIYCISMQRSWERRRHMERHFRRLGWDATFVDGVDGSALDLESLRRSGLLHAQDEGLNGHLTGGEIGCALSHETAWRTLQQGRARYALICEDDIALPTALDLRALLRWTPGDADLVYLHYTNYPGRECPQIGAAFDPELDRPAVRVGAYTLFRAWSCGGSACYLLSLKGAQLLLGRTRPLRYPSDGLLARLTAQDVLRAYVLDPRPVALQPFASNIR